MGINKEKLFSLNLLLFGFMCSFTASGTLPLISKITNEVNSSLAFAPYFACAFLGQLLVYFSKSLRDSRGTLVLAQSIFFITVICIRSTLMDPSSPSLVPLIIAIRGLEGLSLGIAIPLIFEIFIHSKVGKSIDTRLILMNAIQPLGFVLGLPIAKAWSVPSFDFLQFASVVLAFTVVASFFLRNARQRSEVKADVIQAPSTSAEWFKIFYMSFLAKCFYGFLISHIIFQSHIFPFGLAWITFVLCLLFVVGNILGAVISKRVSQATLQISLPFLLSIFLLALAGTQAFPALVLCSFTQAMILFVGMKGIAKKPDTSKEFSLVNSLSDPGSILGSSIALLGGLTPYYAIATLGLVPLLIFAVSGKRKGSETT